VQYLCHSEAKNKNKGAKEIDKEEEFKV